MKIKNWVEYVDAIENGEHVDVREVLRSWKEYALRDLHEINNAQLELYDLKKSLEWKKDGGYPVEYSRVEILTMDDVITVAFFTNTEHGPLWRVDSGEYFYKIKGWREIPGVKK